MVKAGILVHIARGLYTLPNRTITENETIVHLATKYPQGIICLLSALRFYEVGTQAPFEVWFAIPNKARPPVMDYPPLRVIRFSGDALTDGINVHVIDGLNIRITSLARTIVDCFKFRNKIGIDVALESLRECWQNKRVSMDELWHFAEGNRVTKIIRPYLESLI